MSSFFVSRNIYKWCVSHTVHISHPWLFSVCPLLCPGHRAPFWSWNTDLTRKIDTLYCQFLIYQHRSIWFQERPSENLVNLQAEPPIAIIYDFNSIILNWCCIWANGIRYRYGFQIFSMHRVGIGIGSWSFSCKDIFHTIPKRKHMGERGSHCSNLTCVCWGQPLVFDSLKISHLGKLLLLKEWIGSIS